MTIDSTYRQVKDTQASSKADLCMINKYKRMFTSLIIREMQIKIHNEMSSNPRENDYIHVFSTKNVQYWWGYRAGDLSYIVEKLNLYRHLRSQQEVYLKPKTNRGTTTSWSCSQSTHFSPSLSLCAHREYIFKKLIFFKELEVQLIWAHMSS